MCSVDLIVDFCWSYYDHAYWQLKYKNEKSVRWDLHSRVLRMMWRRHDLKSNRIKIRIPRRPDQRTIQNSLLDLHLVQKLSIIVPLTLKHVIAAIVFSSDSVRTRNSNIQHRQATENYSWSQKISRTQRRMKGNKSENDRLFCVIDQNTDVKSDNETIFRITMSKLQVRMIWIILVKTKSIRKRSYEDLTVDFCWSCWDHANWQLKDKNEKSVRWDLHSRLLRMIRRLHDLKNSRMKNENEDGERRKDTRKRKN